MSSIDRRRADAMSSAGSAGGASGQPPPRYMATNFITKRWTSSDTFEYMAIGYSAFDRIAVEQRRPCFAANDQSEFPSDVSGVPKRRIEPLTAKRAGQMRGVAEQKSAPIACALGGTHVHLEIGPPIADRAIRCRRPR